MSNKPTHTAYIVEEPRAADGKSIFHPIASVWVHKDGDGLNVKLPPGVTVSGELVIRRNKAKAD